MKNKFFLVYLMGQVFCTFNHSPTAQERLCFQVWDAEK